MIEDFIKHLGQRASLNIAHIAPRDVKTFRDLEVKAGKAPKTCNLAVKVIGGAFNAARRQGLIQANPAEALESLHHQPRARRAASRVWPLVVTLSTK